MKMFRLSSLLFMTFSFALLASCRLTRNDVVGRWSDHGDTLIINNDDSFLFTKYRSKKDSQFHAVDTTLKAILPGRWKLDKKSIHFEFRDTTQNFGAGCTTYQYWKRLSKKKLIRPRTCQSPTHEFWVITKIK